MNDSFFGKNGTLQDLMGFAKSYSENEHAQKVVSNFGGLKSDSAMDRLSSLVKIVGSIVAMCA